MNESKHPRAVTGLIILAILCTVALGLQEQRSAPWAVYSPLSPVGPGSRALRGLRERAREGTVLARLLQRAQQPQRAELSQRAEPSPRAELGPPTLSEVATRAFWLQPGPWIGLGLVGFGLLAWGLLRAVRRMERD